MKFLNRKSEEYPEKGNKPKNIKYVLPDQQELTLNSNNLVPVVLQDEVTRDVLHLGYMDRFALNSSLERGVVYLYRRSKRQLEVFGKEQDVEYHIRSVFLDRFHRSLLMLVKPISRKNGQAENTRSFMNTVTLANNKEQMM
jgi:phosphoribosyl-AMP cyclohydrolase